MNRAVVSSYTARTTAFASATGITDTTILGALNTFDTGLILNGLDTKMKALYPFVGGTATTHKYNFMNALDTNGAFRLSFNGGWTHSSTGALPNGTNAYADTFYVESADTGTINNFSLGFYSGTNNSSSGIDIGAFSSNALLLRAKNGSNMECYIQTSGTIGSYAVANSLGFSSASRIASLQFKMYKNAIPSTIPLTSIGTPCGVSLHLASFNTGSPSNYANKDQRFTYFSSGLTDGEMTTLYNLVQTFQTTLSRNV
jgi:hypothetical protein